MEFFGERREEEKMMGREEEWITPWERVLFIQDKEKERVF